MAISLDQPIAVPARAMPADSLRAKEIAEISPASRAAGRREEAQEFETLKQHEKAPIYDRAKLMKRAGAARSKGKYKKAIGIYQQLLEYESDNPELHKKLAPLYVKTRRAPEALGSYQVAAEGLLRQGFEEQASGLLRGAVEHLPQEVILWQSIAALDLKRGRPVDAFDTLVEGRRHMRRRSQRPQAVELLERAHEIDPADFHVSFDLAGLLSKTGRIAKSLRMLEKLASRPNRKHLARVRARQLRLAPTPAALWRYVRALVLRR